MMNSFLCFDMDDPVNHKQSIRRTQVALRRKVKKQALYLPWLFADTHNMKTQLRKAFPVEEVAPVDH